MINRTTRKADAVLAVVECQIFDDAHLYLEPYQNGREHGWALWSAHNRKEVVFAENRNSDHIVIYLGKMGEFEMAGNVPDEEVWEGRRLLAPNAYYEAAEIIIAHLCNE